MNSKPTAGTLCFWAVFAVFLVQLTFVDRLVIAGFALNYPWTGLALVSGYAFAMRLRKRVNAEQFWSWQTLFWLVLFFYLSNLRWHGSDNLPTSLLPFSIIRERSFYLNSFYSWFDPGHLDNIVRGRSGWVSFYPVLGALLALPIYFLPAVRGVVPSDHVLHQLEKVSASLICAFAVVVYFSIYRRQLSARRSFFYALMFGLGTNMFSLASQALWQYGPSNLILVGALWAMTRADLDRRMWYLLGAFASLLVAARTPNAIFSVSFTLAAVLHPEQGTVRRFSLGALGPTILLLLYWTLVVGTGMPAEFSFQRGLLRAVPSLEALIGLLISPGRGLLLFVPFTAFAVWGMFRGIRTRQVPRWQYIPISVSIIGSYYFFASYAAWGGGFSFGPRYLSEIVTLLFYFVPFAPFEFSKKSASAMGWRIVAGASVLCHAIGAYSTWNWEKLVEKGSVWHVRAYPPIYLLGLINASKSRPD